MANPVVIHTPIPVAKQSPVVISIDNKVKDPKTGAVVSALVPKDPKAGTNVSMATIKDSKAGATIKVTTSKDAKTGANLATFPDLKIYQR